MGGMCVGLRVVWYVSVCVCGSEDRGCNLSMKVSLSITHMPTKNQYYQPLHV